MTDAYHEVIDELVHVAGGASKSNAFEKLGPRSYQKRLDIIKNKLSDEDKVFLEHHEKTRWIAAIHDVAARFDWLTSCGNLTLNLDGAAIGESPYTNWHYDFMMRMEGVPWNEFVAEGNT